MGASADWFEPGPIRMLSFSHFAILFAFGTAVVQVLLQFSRDSSAKWWWWLLFVVWILLSCIIALPIAIRPNGEWAGFGRLVIALTVALISALGVLVPRVLLRRDARKVEKEVTEIESDLNTALGELEAMTRELAPMPDGERRSALLARIESRSVYLRKQIDRCKRIRANVDRFGSLNIVIVVYLALLTYLSAFNYGTARGVWAIQNRSSIWHRAPLLASGDSRLLFTDGHLALRLEQTDEKPTFVLSSIDDVLPLSREVSREHSRRVLTDVMGPPLPKADGPNAR